MLVMFVVELNSTISGSNLPQPLTNIDTDAHYKLPIDNFL